MTKEKMSVFNHHTGKEFTVEIDENEWVDYDKNKQFALKQEIVCFSYVLSFHRDLEKGEILLTYIEEIKND